MTGIGDTRQLMLQSLLSLAFSVPIIVVMVAFSVSLSPPIGALVGILGIVLSTLPGTIWGLVWVWRRYGVKADFEGSAKIFAVSGISALASYLVATLAFDNLDLSVFQLG